MGKREVAFIFKLNYQKKKKTFIQKLYQIYNITKITKSCRTLVICPNSNIVLMMYFSPDDYT